MIGRVIEQQTFIKHSLFTNLKRREVETWFEKMCRSVIENDNLIFDNDNDNDKLIYLQKHNNETQ